MSTEHYIFDQNLEQLLRKSYQPENPDPAFVANMTARMQAAASEHAPRPAADVGLQRRRMILGWLMAGALLVAGAAIWHRAPKSGFRNETGGAISAQEEVEITGLTARPRTEPAKLETLATGATAKTGANERRRVGLPDGSVVYLNADSAIRVETDRRLHLEQGEMFIEVAPKSGQSFVVQTPDRRLVALGTKFMVRNRQGKTGVVVTQGKVQVSGLESVLEAGEQLLPDENKAVQAPRATALLDWARDLIADSPLVPGNKHCGGSLLAFNPDGQEAKISLRKFHLDVHIEDGRKCRVRWTWK